jgi:hypothetical protein
MRTWSLFGVGMGRVSSLRTSGPPASWTTAAFIVAILDVLVENWYWNWLGELLYELVTNMYSLGGLGWIVGVKLEHFHGAPYLLYRCVVKFACA